jgi:hypothetical protein
LGKIDREKKETSGKMPEVKLAVDNELQAISCQLQAWAGGTRAQGLSAESAKVAEGNKDN